ncbi:monovalent cation/H(+) antiporter subunit G [Halorubellus salinus]|uniref:monovalent cation/H(+) antiporter subunit G n=1 Tax=Halorubellus salinus TaxID=755309 RepID=UPI0034A3EC06
MLASLPNAIDGIASSTTSADAVPLAAGGSVGLTGPIQAALVVALVVVGTFFLVVGVVGLVRLPSVYNRMHATSKATTLGASSMLLAGFLYFGGDGSGLAALVAVAFLFITAPTGAHMISRAAQKMGIPFEETVTWPRDD